MKWLRSKDLRRLLAVFAWFFLGDFSLPYYSLLSCVLGLLFSKELRSDELSPYISLLLLLHFLSVASIIWLFLFSHILCEVLELLPDSLEMSIEHREFLFRIPYMNVYDFFLIWLSDKLKSISGAGIIDRSITLDCTCKIFVSVIDRLCKFTVLYCCTGDFVWGFNA